MRTLRNPLILLAVMLSVTPLTFAKKASGKKTTIRGYLVDIACVRDRSSEGGDLGPAHTKKCLQMPACERSGYAVMDAANNVYKFDARGNQMAKRLIAVTDKEKDWRIAVSGRLLGDEITVAKLLIQR